MALKAKNEARLRQLWKHSDQIGIDSGDVDRFLPKLSEVSECWLWEASRRSDNTWGQFNCWTTDGKRVTQLVHRIVFQLREKRKLDRSSEVYQSCGHTLCVNPDHLLERRGVRLPRMAKTARTKQK